MRFLRNFVKGLVWGTALALFGAFVVWLVTGLWKVCIFFFSEAFFRNIGIDPVVMAFVAFSIIIAAIIYAIANTEVVIELRYDDVGSYDIPAVLASDPSSTEPPKKEPYDPRRYP